MSHPGEALRTLDLDGARLRYLEVGCGDPVVLLHGYPQSHRCWRHQIGPLAESHRVVALDWLGWGESERTCALAPEYEAEVARLARVLDALAPGSCTLVTHDYGGYLGLGLVLRHPERVRRFAIMNSRAHRTFASAFYRQTALQCFMARRPVLRPLLAALPAGAIHRRALAPYVARGCFDRALLDHYVGWMDGREGRRWLAHFYAHYDVRLRPELDRGVARISCPTTVLWGDRDPFCPIAIAEDLAARVPAATFVRLRGGGHFIMEERPADVLAAIRALLARPA